ncbi:MAG: SUMF1/EgtB/PvdO family nonheme iron enzyme [Pirellula sp.]
MGTDRVNRGGCWLYQAARCRSASRNWAKPSYRDGLLGFRVTVWYCVCVTSNAPR